MHDSKTRKAWLDSAQVVVDALSAWGKQTYISEYSDSTYSEFHIFDLEGALLKVIERGREELRPKFDRRDAENDVWPSGDYPGMFRATKNGRLLGVYKNREHALDALEAVFNAEATK